LLSKTVFVIPPLWDFSWGPEPGKARVLSRYGSKEEVEQVHMRGESIKAVACLGVNVTVPAEAVCLVSDGMSQDTSVCVGKQRYGRTRPSRRFHCFTIGSADNSNAPLHGHDSWALSVDPVMEHYGQHL